MRRVAEIQPLMLLCIYAEGRFDDGVVASAAAEISGQSILHLLRPRLGLLFKEIGQCHDKARSAKTTLAAKIAHH